MNAKIRLTRRDLGFTIADDRTGLRIEVVELPDGLMLEAYGYHSGSTVRLDAFAAGAVGPHPEVLFRMTDPRPVTARPGR